MSRVASLPLYFRCTFFVTIHLASLKGTSFEGTSFLKILFFFGGGGGGGGDSPKTLLLVQHNKREDTGTMFYYSTP